MNRHIIEKIIRATRPGNNHTKSINIYTNIPRLPIIDLKKNTESNNIFHLVRTDKPILNANACSHYIYTNTNNINNQSTPPNSYVFNWLSPTIVPSIDDTLNTILNRPTSNRPRYTTQQSWNPLDSSNFPQRGIGAYITNIIDLLIPIDGPGDHFWECKAREIAIALTHYHIITNSIENTQTNFADIATDISCLISNSDEDNQNIDRILAEYANTVNNYIDLTADETLSNNTTAFLYNTRNTLHQFASIPDKTRNAILCTALNALRIFQQHTIAEHTSTNSFALSNVRGIRTNDQEYIPITIILSNDETIQKLNNILLFAISVYLNDNINNPNDGPFALTKVDALPPTEESNIIKNYHILHKNTNIFPLDNGYIEHITTHKNQTTTTYIPFENIIGVSITTE